MFPIVARNSFFGAFGKLSIKLISFAFIIFMVRWLGDEGYGEYTLIWSYVMIFAMLSDAGLGMYAIREIAKKQAGSQYIAGNIIAMRIILAIITIALMMITAWYLDYSLSFLLNTFLASTILLLYAVQDPIDAVLQANERFDILAVAVIVGQLTFVGLGAILLWLGWHVTGLIIAALLNVLISALVAWQLMANYRTDLQWRLKPALWFEFIRVSLPFGLIKLWLSWSLKLDIVILSWFWTHQMVGWYAAAYSIVLGITVISNSINAALYPALSRQYAQAPASLPGIYELVLKYLLLLSLPLAGGIFLTAGKVTHLLYGAEFVPAAAALVILIWGVPLMFVSEFLRYVLLAIGQERTAVRTLGFAILFTIMFNLWLIPLYGFLAAAIVVIAAEALLVLLYTRHLRLELKSIHVGDMLLKPVLAALFMMVGVGASASFSLFWQVFLGGLIYLASIWVLRVVKPGEYTLLSSLLKYTKKSLPVFATKKGGRTGPLVSVFIPTYNAGQFLAQAIESVLAQTYQNYELIIVDDGSTDQTDDILQRYQAHPKITIHRNPQNKGMAANWNIGLSLCRGEFIAKLDADDFYEPDYLEAVIEIFQKHRTVGLIFSGLNLLYPDGRSEPEVAFLHSWVRQREAFLPTLLRLCVIRSPTVCVRRICYEQLGGFIEQMRIHADWEMWVRITANYGVGFIARRLATYRMSYGSNCTAQAAIDGRSMQDLRLWLKLLEQDELPYRLSPAEQIKFRWGIYEIEIHFAAVAAYYYQQTDMQQAYTAFAEEVLASLSPPNQVEKMRRVMLDLHQGICAFREQQLKEARRYFLQAIKVGPTYCRPLWIWNKLLLTFIGRTKWGIMYK